MGDPTGEADKSAPRFDFERRLLLQFRGSSITSDAGLLAYRELDAMQARILQELASGWSVYLAVDEDGRLIGFWLTSPKSAGSITFSSRQAASDRELGGLCSTSPNDRRPRQCGFARPLIILEHTALERPALVEPHCESGVQCGSSATRRLIAIWSIGRRRRPAHRRALALAGETSTRSTRRPSISTTSRR
jgi:hypothetical protein